jgi:hypothetical protein
MFRLITTVRRGTANDLAAAAARYPTIDAARTGSAEVPRDERVLRVMIAHNEIPSAFVHGGTVSSDRSRVARAAAFLETRGKRLSTDDPWDLRGAYQTAPKSRRWPPGRRCSTTSRGRRTVANGSNAKREVALAVLLYRLIGSVLP